MAGNAPGGIAVITVFFQESADGHALFELDRALQGTRVVSKGDLSFKESNYYQTKRLTLLGILLVLSFPMIPPHSSDTTVH